MSNTGFYSNQSGTYKDLINIYNYSSPGSQSTGCYAINGKDLGTIFTSYVSGSTTSCGFYNSSKVDIGTLFNLTEPITRLMYYTFEGITLSQLGYTGSVSLNTSYYISGSQSLYIGNGIFWPGSFTIPTGGFSVSVWCYNTNFNGRYNPRVFELNADGVFYYATTSSTTTLHNDYNALGTISLNTWYHVVVTFDTAAQEIKYYLNNSLVFTKSSTSYTDGNSVGLQFGEKNTVYNNAYIGYMDNIAIYSGVLTTSQISYIYSNKL
jgi:hypothetical protein